MSSDHSAKDKTTISNIAPDRKTGWIGKTVDSVKSLQFRHVLTQTVELCLVVASVLVIWKALMFVTGTETPVAVLVSRSMEPALRKGDLLLVHKSKELIREGDIVLFNVDGREIPGVNRVIEVHERDAGGVEFLTKGDNMYGDGRKFYAPGQFWLQQQHIGGKVVRLLPYVGWVTIIITEIQLSSTLS